MSRIDDAKKDYVIFISKFNFPTMSDMRMRGNKVFLKLMIALIVIEFLIASILYVFSVFTGAVNITLIDAINTHSTSLLLKILAANLAISLIGRMLIMLKLKRDERSAQLSQTQKERILQVSKSTPKLHSIIMDRIAEQGYISISDYNHLAIDDIFMDTEHRL